MVVGTKFALATTTTGHLYSWGWNDRYQLARPQSAIGQDRAKPVSGLTGILIDRVTAGGGHATALARDGKLYCWGANESHQCGREPTNPVQMPIPVVDPSTSPRFAEVAAGGQHTCARNASDGQIYCWGANASGQLGIGSAGVPVSTPTQAKLQCR